MPGQAFVKRCICPNIALPISAPLSPDQGISMAGAQMSMMDSRSSLVQEPFRLWDESAASGCPMTLEHAYHF